MKTALGILTSTIGSAIYDYAVQLKEGNFFVSNGDEVVTEDMIGNPVLVRYEPQDQFCKVIPIEEIDELLKEKIMKTLDPNNHVAKNSYTVIGFYRDNNQPWMEHVTAPDPKSAAGKALVKLSAASSGDPAVVEVIAGHHSGKLCNETLMVLQEGVMGEVGGS